MNTLYHEELVEHYKYPKNKKSIHHAHFSANDENPSCGDSISFEGIIENNILTDIGFDGKGCVISQATTSMLTDFCLGKSVDELNNLTEEDIFKLIQIPLGPVRAKCATLSLQVLNKGLAAYLSTSGKKQ